MKLLKTEIDAIDRAAAHTKRKIRSISLDDAQFEMFQNLCEKEGVAANKIIDALIGLYIESKGPK